MKVVLDRLIFLLFVLLLIGNTACTVSPEAVATAAVTNVAEPAATPAVLARPSSTPSQASSPTATPPDTSPTLAEATAVPTSESVATREMAVGFQLIIANFNGIFAFNDDVAQVTPLVAGPIAIGSEGYGWQTAVSPNGRYLAFSAPSDVPKTLQLLDTQSDTISLITPLFSEATQPGPEDDCLGEDNFSNRCQAGFTVGKVAWSPDGTMLAFVSAHAGSSSDVYVYELANQQITQLTSGPAAASRLSWSPDSQTIFHFGVEFYSGSGSEAVLSGWAARADGSELVKLHEELNSQAETIVGWYDAETIVVYSTDINFCGVNLRAHNIHTGTTTLLWNGSFAQNGIAMQPNGNLLLETTCSAKEDWFLYLITLPEGEIVPVSEAQPIFPINPHWSAKLNGFYSRYPDGWQLFSADGQVVTYNDLAVSLPDSVPPDAIPSAHFWAWTGLDDNNLSHGVWVKSTDTDKAPQLIFDKRADQLLWSPAGDTLFFLSGTNPVILYMAYAPAFLPQPVTTDELRGAYWDVVLTWKRP